MRLPLSLSLLPSASLSLTRSPTAKYERLIEEEAEAVRLMRKEEEMPLAPDFDFSHPSLSLSHEESQLLARVRPATVGSRFMNQQIEREEDSRLVYHRSQPLPECRVWIPAAS